MQLKTIRKNITSKIEEWISTITDESLKKDLKSKVLVSGGCIASMLLNEDVNDYDVYIKDRDVLFRLTKYYTSMFSSARMVILDGHEKPKYESDLAKDYQWVLSDKQFEEVDIKDICNSYAISVRNLEPEQVKLYFYAQIGFRPDYNTDNEKPYRPLFFSPNAISLSDNLQIVIRFWGDNTKIHESFDFIHATNYFTFDEGLVTNKAALESLITRQLKYQGSLYPLTSIIRARKFIKRGWNIGAGELLKIMFQISELNLKNIDILSEQLIGVDVAYFDKLVKILSNIPEDKISSNYLNTIIDKVFDDENFED